MSLIVVRKEKGKNISFISMLLIRQCIFLELIALLLRSYLFMHASIAQVESI